jgi:hypothetical protein
VAAEGRIPCRHEDVFPVAVLLLGVEPVNDFEKVKAKVEDPQERDRETGRRMWAASILDPSAREGRREIKVKIPAEVQPVPPNGLMAPVEFEGLRSSRTWTTTGPAHAWRSPIGRPGSAPSGPTPPSSPSSSRRSSFGVRVLAPPGRHPSHGSVMRCPRPRLALGPGAPHLGTLGEPRCRPSHAHASVTTRHYARTVDGQDAAVAAAFDRPLPQGEVARGWHARTVRPPLTEVEEP